jgi:eukaryotic-like serine/threonine-protein kinase
MQCASCRSTDPPIDGRCPGCGTLAVPDSSIESEGTLGSRFSERTVAGPNEIAGETMGDAGPTVLPPPGSGGAGTGITLAVGHDFGTRYHIIRVLGKGGMGAVYQAWDKVLEVAVAIKVIRPEATTNPEEAKALEKRFKRELLLARQVTHRNVVRIHDIGEVDGITYITMPYVQGSDLASVLKAEGRLAIDRALEIARHVASGLAAAHKAGVVHRDLKPANIMLTADDEALIMDFGIARSTSSTGVGMTVAGAVVGTVEYMAPEQAQGAAVDQRADIYSFGLILHDMLVGRRERGASSVISELMQRIRAAPPSVRTHDPAIPEWLDALITRCLQPNLDARWQSINDVVSALGYSPGETTATAPATTITPESQPTASIWTRLSPRRALAAGALVLVLAGTGYLAWSKSRAASTTTTTAAPASVVSLAVLPFRNASGDSTLDTSGSSLSQVLATMLGQSAQVRTVAPDRLQQVLRDLRIAPNANLTSMELARVADFTSTRHVVWGQISRFGNTIRIDATLQDLDRNETIPLSAVAPSETALLAAVAELAADVQLRLSRGSSDVLSELKSTAWRPTTNSFEALRRYNEGVDLTRQGSHQPALKSFEAAVAEDENFALALSALAQSYATLGYDNEAAQFSRQAMSLSDPLPPQEKHRIAASHYRITNDADRAVESYENILKASPGDVTIRFTLGGLYEQRGELDRAREHFAAIVAQDAKFVEALLALGRVDIRRGQPQESLQSLDRANALAIELGNREARANVLQAIGIAHMRLNRPAEALRHYEQSLAIKREIGDKRGMAASLVQIAEVKRSLGEPKVAEQSYREALKLRREIRDNAGLSLTLIELASLLDDQFGRPAEALPLLQEALTIVRDTGNRNLEARALNNIGAVYATQARYADAQTNFERALEIREKAMSPQETADTLHNLATTFTRMGRYEVALQRYIRALEFRRSAGDRRSAAIEQNGIGTLLELQGRYGAAVESKKEAEQAFRELGLRDATTVDILGGYGRSLVLSGRSAEADAPLKEALSLARELKNGSLIAQTLRYHTERAYYVGDLTAAQQLAAQAEAAAKQTLDQELLLHAQVTLAMVTSATQPSRNLANSFGTFAREAEKLGLRALAAECGAFRALTLLRLKELSAAAQEANRAIAAADALGLRVPMAIAQYVSAAALGAKGGAAARREYAAAVRMLEQVRNDTGNGKVLERADLAVIHAESVRGASGT